MKRNGDGATAGRYDRPMTPFADISRSRVARYLQLAELFRNRVNSGEWPVNGRIPNVEDLARECGVARGTIREAIGVLVDEGIIETFRAKGTFVRKSPQASRTHHLETDWRSIIETHEGVEIRVLEQKLNNHPKLAPEDKLEFQQLISRAYGSLTTFNILFREEEDRFIGLKGES